MENAFDRASFRQKLWKLMLPVILQNLLSAVVSTADVFMLSGISQNALSASALAGQVTFVLTLFYMGLSTGASVLAAQYWGRKDKSAIGMVQGLALRYSALVSLLFFAAALAIPAHDFFVGKNALFASFIGVEDFTAQRQNRLIFSHASAFGRPAGRIPFDQIEF